MLNKSQIVCSDKIQLIIHYYFIIHYYYFAVICLGALFLLKGSFLRFSTEFCIPIFLLSNTFQIVLVWLCDLPLMLIEDVEVNSWPETKDKDYFLIFQWNLSSISTHDYSKLYLLKSYNLLHKFDIICLSEIYLGFTFCWWQFRTFCYTLVRSGHLLNNQARKSLVPWKEYYWQSVTWIVLT